VATVFTFGLFLIAIAWASTRWIVVTQVLLLEELPAGQALSRGWVLTTGHFWRAFGLALVLYLMISVVSAPAQILGFLPFLFLEDGEIANPAAFYGTLAIGQGLSVVLNLLVSPLAALVFTHFYVDLRVRREAGNRDDGDRSG
jgi:hypothetical protein